MPKTKEKPNSETNSTDNKAYRNKSERRRRKHNKKNGVQLKQDLCNLVEANKRADLSKEQRYDIMSGIISGPTVTELAGSPNLLSTPPKKAAGKATKKVKAPAISQTLKDAQDKNQAQQKHIKSLKTQLKNARNKSAAATPELQKEINLLLFQRFVLKRYATSLSGLVQAMGGTTPQPSVSQATVDAFNAYYASKRSVAADDSTPQHSDNTSSPTPETPSILSLLFESDMNLDDAQLDEDELLATLNEGAINPSNE